MPVPSSPIGAAQAALARCIDERNTLGAMPLSAIQTEKLKTATTVIIYKEVNPKKAGTRAHERYDTYKTATTVEEAKTWALYGRT